MIKTMYTLEKHLNSCCENDKRYIRLKNIYDFNKDVICDALKQINRYFSSYSNHDETHSEAIIAAIESLLGEDRIESLSPTDTFLILLSAYLHDISMNIDYDQVKKLITSKKFQEFLQSLSEIEDYKKYAEYFLDVDFTNEFFESKTWKLETIQYVNIVISEYYRRDHAQNSKKVILDGFKDKDIVLNPNKKLPERIFEVLAEITKLHGSNFEDVLKQDQEANGIGNDKIHPRFIAMLIRIGDLLDLDNNRFNESLIKSVYGNELSSMSMIHYEKHKSIKSFLIKPEQIYIVATSEKDNVIRETKKWMKWLEEESDNLTKYWNEIIPLNFPGSSPRLKVIVTKSNSEDKFCEENLELNFSSQKAFDIIQGANIYSDNLVFVREFIQNALDAIKFQFWNDIRYDERFIKKDKEGKINIQDTKDYITESYYNNELDEYIKRYSIRIKIFDCRKEKGLENLKKHFNSESFENSLKESFNGKLVITFEDNGTGISQNDFVERLIKVGKKDKDKFYKKNVRDMPSFLKPTGGFGIGLQSAFLVADSIVIQTKTIMDNCFGREIIIESGVKNGFVQCNKLNVEDEEKFIPRNYTKMFIPVDTNKLEINAQDDEINNMYTFPFEDNHEGFLLASIKQKVLEYLKESIFEIVINEKIVIRQQNLIDLKREKTLRNSKYDIRFYSKATIIIIDRLSGHTLTLTLTKDCKSKNVQALYKGINISNKELLHKLENCILTGTNASINYNFEKTSEYLKLNRDSVTKKGLGECEKIMKDLMSIAIKEFHDFLSEKYSSKEDKIDIENYLYVSKQLTPIAKGIAEAFSEFLTIKESDFEKINEVEYIENFVNNTEYDFIFSSVIDEKNIKYLLEVFIKRIAQEIWNISNYNVIDEDYLSNRNFLCKLIVVLLNKYNIKKNMIPQLKKYCSDSKELTNNDVSKIFNTFGEETCNFESNFLCITYANEFRFHIDRIFNEEIPTVLIFLYHIKYANNDILEDKIYISLLQVLSDHYISIRNYKICKNRGGTPIYFGSEIISEFPKLFVDNDSLQNLVAIYPIQELDIEEGVFTAFTKIKYLKHEKGNPVFIKYESNDIKLIKYLFDGLINGKIGSEEGFYYCNSWNFYCIPAIDKYKNIAVDKMPPEFEIFYMNSKFKDIQQNNYIMLPVTIPIIKEFEEFIEEYIFFNSDLNNKEEIRFNGYIGLYFDFIKKSILEKDYLVQLKLHRNNLKSVTDTELEINKNLIELCIDVTESLKKRIEEYKIESWFENMVEYTYQNRSIKAEVSDSEEFKKMIKGEYGKLLEELFVYIIEYLC